MLVLIQQEGGDSLSSEALPLNSIPQTPSEAPSPPQVSRNGVIEAGENGIAAPEVFDDNAVDYECDDLALEVNKDEFLDLMEEEELEGAGAAAAASGCYYCDDVRVDVSDQSAFALHLREEHSVRKNVDFLAEVTLGRHRRGGNLCHDNACRLVSHRSTGLSGNTYLVTYQERIKESSI